MKKFVAIIVILVAIFSMASSLADGYWFDGNGWWRIDYCGEWHKLYKETDALTWKTYLANYNFPSRVITDETAMCNQFGGTPIGCFGLTSNQGSNLRSYPTLEGQYELNLKEGRMSWVHSSIVKKVHANTTVYIYFSCFDSEGKEWYYATCADGTTGFLFANRIKLLPD